MIDSTRSPMVRCDDILAALRARGFTCEIVADHAVATRDATRLVVPAAGRTVPEMFARRLEHALRPLLGQGWLQPDPASRSERTDGPGAVRVRAFDAIVDQCPTSGQWCAFLPEMLSVMGTGATRDDALRDLKSAAALWCDLPAENVLLLTPDLL